MRYSKVLLVFALSLLMIFGSSLSAFATGGAPTITVSVEPDNSETHNLVSQSVNYINPPGPGNDYHEGTISATNSTNYYFVEWQKKDKFGNYSFYSTEQTVSGILFYFDNWPANYFRNFKAIYAEKPDLTVVVNDTTMGGFNPSTAPGKYLPGTPISITPVLAQGFRLDYWEYNGVSHLPSELVSFNMPSIDVEIKLYFEPIPSFNITTDVEDEDDWGTVSEGGSYMVGSPVNLIAENERGFDFVNWTIVWDSDEFPLPIIDATQKDITFNMPECNGTFTANFEPLTKYGVNLLVGKIVDNAKEPALAGEGGNPLFDANVMTVEDGEYDGYYYEGERYNIDPNPFEHWSFVGYDWEGIWEDNDGPEIATIMAPLDGPVLPPPPIPMLMFDADIPDFLFKVFDFNKEITVYYVEDPHVLATVKYLNTSDVPVKDQEVVKIYLDEAYDLTGPATIGAYQRIYKSDNAVGTLGEGATDFTVTNVYQIPPTPQVITNTVTETITETVFVNVPTTTAPTTEPVTEAVTEEETPLAPATTEPTTEAPVEVIAVEEVPLADALPQTGQLPSELFYAVGSAISGLGLFLKRRK